MNLVNIYLHLFTYLMFVKYSRRVHTHTLNRFTALLEYVRDHPGEQVPER